MIKISPSLLACDFAAAGEGVARIERAGADWLHLDVMDGLFVPNISFGNGVISALRKHSTLFFDVHLMIVDPIRYIEDFHRAGADLCTIHVESCADPAATLRAIRTAGMKAGISIKPSTPVSAILPYLSEVDLVLVMTVEPGFGGQKLIPATVDKVRELRTILDQAALPIDLEVDGGVTAANAGELIRAGANVLVAGSAIFGATDPEEAIRSFRMLEQ